MKEGGRERGKEGKEKNKVCVRESQRSGKEEREEKGRGLDRERGSS